MRQLNPLCKPALAMLLCAAGWARPASATPCPNIMFVLDQSGSMDEDPNGGYRHPTKWELLQQAVVDIVTKYGDQVPFGLEMYASSGGGDAACYADTKIDVQIGHDTAADIISKVMAAKPTSATNTAQAIRRAATEIKSPPQVPGQPPKSNVGRGNYIILVTDGDPNCPYADSSGASYTVKELTDATAGSPSIHTFVIGFDGTNGVDPDNLNAMATAGLEPISGCTSQVGSPCYYSASNAQKLNDALAAIINQVAGGEFGSVACDDSCVSNGCDPGFVCGTDELNTKPHCIADPCYGVNGTCSSDSYCRQGACVRACLTPCRQGERCVDGDCLTDPCAGVSCGTGLVCNPATGTCITNLCATQSCAGTTVCDVTTGNCVDDQCRYVTCPDGMICRAGGNCEATQGGLADRSGRVPVGCSVAVRTTPPGVALFGLLLVVGLIGRRYF